MNKYTAFLITVLKEDHILKYAIRIQLTNNGLGDNCLRVTGKQRNKETLFSLLPDRLKVECKLVTVEKIDDCLQVGVIRNG